MTARCIRNILVRIPDLRTAALETLATVAYMASLFRDRPVETSVRHPSAVPVTL
jgi:hypothetical protein